MASLSRLLLVEGVLGFVSGQWLREDLSSRPHVWLRPDFVPLSPFLIIEDPQAQSSRILVEPHLIDAEFRKAWMPFFCRSGHPVVTTDQFLDFVGHLLPQETFLGLLVGRPPCQRTATGNLHNCLH